MLSTDEIDLKHQAARWGGPMRGAMFCHVKTGGIYEVVGVGLNEGDLSPVVVYRNRDTNHLWVRPVEQWTEDRFEPFPPE